MNPIRDDNTTAQAEQAASLRAAMVDELRRSGAIRTDQVDQAFRSVPRHLFAPDEPLTVVYGYGAVVTKRDEHGVAVSSISAPPIQAMMLEQAQLRPGMRVLEIGSGGVNAALISEMVGENGGVTTVDIDADVVERARRGLTAAGYPSVNVVLADAEHGVPEHAPYDRIIVTVGAWDVPPAWLDQLIDTGQLIVPLRMRGLTRSVVFERDGRHLVSRGYTLCGFVAMQGAGAHGERLELLHHDEVGLRIDGPQTVATDELSKALTEPAVERWSGVEVGGEEPFDDLDLWLATVAPGFCLLTAKDAAIERGLVPRAARFGAPTLMSGGTLGYRVLRPASDETYEFGVRAHGPDADALGDLYIGHIRTWDRAHRRGPGPRIKVHPAATSDSDLPEGLVLEKRHTRVVISWPPSQP